MENIKEFFPKVVAHRARAGVGAAYPDNSLAAIQTVLALGADGVEIDVRLAGEICVLSHDPLSKDPVGSKKIAPARFRDVAAVAGSSLVVAEIKVDPVTDPRRVVARVLVEEIDGRGEVVVSSFDTTALRVVGEEDPHLRRALLGGWQTPFSETLKQARELGVDLIHPFFSHLNEAAMEAANDAGIEVWPWVVNAESECERFFSLGVGGVITDRPVAALSVREGRNL